ncbi:class I SAM-dependent methyltransferase [Sediminicoccus sp. KRV36]|uniref:class I SAM-dependent methyltransferase n=1 Tax=Sediminicoccus sp. KRV36 TaxID=3133721 RepID=UPI00200C33D0|nr:class I SAM-dependent methyltransferase [Sediminicoccus rosea]UPY37803.1 class I SAM-dependent methyltransferase [Sediminicoccus rosea]
MQEPAAAAPAPRLFDYVEMDSVKELLAHIAALRADKNLAPADLHRAISRLQLRPPPIAERMRALDPMSEEYAGLAMELMRQLRGGRDYQPFRDELIGHGMQDRDLWSGLSPYDFRDPLQMSEFCEAYAAMLRQVGAPSGARVLEYGPGSGQFLLMLARLGYQCHAVDVEAEYLWLIMRQAEIMGLDVKCEHTVFGEGFEGERFDLILFFEAFHHAPDFLELLRKLRGRLNPGGRLMLCGEPIMPSGLDYGPVPYPWGPRLDALSVAGIQLGWMELGFQLEFLMQAMVQTGWAPTLFAHPTTGRAHLIVASVMPDPAG